VAAKHEPSAVARTRSRLHLRLLETALGSVRALQFRLTQAQVRLRHAIAFGHRFERRPDDVYIATFPKSGTTLLQMIVHQLRGDGEMDIPHINAVVPWLEPELLNENYAFLAALPAPRVLKTHLLYERLPPGSRVIYVVRDVREVFVSVLHHQSMMLGQRLTPEELAPQFLHGEPFLGNWFEHLESWWPHRRDPNVLFLTYAGMVGDLEGTVRRVAAFCGLPLDESRMPRILERCGIEYMRRHEAKFDPRLQVIDPGLQGFIRQGKAGRWREELPETQREELESRATALARRLGSGEEDPFGYLLHGPGEAAREAASLPAGGYLATSPSKD
jgi:Sulfotransferase domain